LSLLTAVVAVQAASTGHRDLIMVSWWARAIPVVLAVIAVGSGVVLSLVTSWGFGRWRWLLVKQAMVVALVVGGAVELVAGFDALWARACTLALLLGVVGVSMVKPGGRVKKKVAPSR
jgi:hypothetical protein